MDDSRVSTGTTFPSRLGHWSLDDEKLRIETGPRPLFEQIYARSKPAFALLVLVVVYVPLGIVVDAGLFNLELSAVFLLGVAFFLALVALTRLVGHLRGLSFRNSIPTDDIAGVVFREVMGTTALLVVFEEDGVPRQRQIVAPVGWWADVDAELDRVRAALRHYEIPIDESGAGEVRFEHP